MGDVTSVSKATLVVVYQRRTLSRCHSSGYFAVMAERLPQGDPDRLTGGFIKAGGNGIGGLQIATDPRDLTHTAGVELKKGAGKGKRTPLAALGLNKKLIDEGSPEFATCLAYADGYRKVRMRELAKLHGHVSAGAGALLASASLALAASRFLYQCAAKDGDGRLLKQASQLADSARASELAAWELSAREGVLKRRHEASEAGMPWLRSADGYAAKPGRKSNVERAEAMTLESPAPVVESGEEVDVYE